MTDEAIGAVLLIIMGVVLFWRMINVWDQRDIEDPRK